jgi:hypothetical protein
MIHHAHSRHNTQIAATHEHTTTPTGVDGAKSVFDTAWKGRPVVTLRASGLEMMQQLPKNNATKVYLRRAMGLPIDAETMKEAHDLRKSYHTAADDAQTAIGLRVRKASGTAFRSSMGTGASSSSSS